MFDIFRLFSIIILLIIVIFFILSSNLYSQSNEKLKGSVYDNSDGMPVSGAIIEIEKTGYKATTDDFGRFEFRYLPGGVYSIEVSAPGYDSYIMSKIEIVADITRQVNIKLTPRIYWLDKIKVNGERIRLSSDNIEIFRKHQIESSPARDLPELLDDITGLYVLKTGTAGSRAQIKIRGCDSRHVLLLLDGNKLNPSGNGVADLSTIPLDIIERIEVHKGGGSAEFGPDALGGVINIITHQDNIRDGLILSGESGRGNYGTKTYNFNIDNIISSQKISGKYTYSSIESDGDFDFSYTVLPQNYTYTGNRTNNYIDTYSHFISGLYQFTDRTKLSYSGQYYKTTTGLPDRANKQNEYAWFGDRRKLINISLSREISANNNLNTDFAFSRFEQRYVNDSAVSKYDSRYTNDIFTIRGIYNRLPWKNNKIKIGSEFRRDILYHSELAHPSQSMGKTIRDNASIFFTDEQQFDISPLLAVDIITFDGSLRFDWVETRKDSTSVRDNVKTNDIGNWSPKIGMSLSKGDRFFYIIRGSYGKSLSLPSINSLFWVGDARSYGNPGLKPERSEHSEAGFELRGKVGPVSFSGGMTYFHSFINNLVVWQPYVGVWQPVNLDKAQITGHEDFVDVSLFDDFLFLSYQNSITTALNKTYNKRTAHTTYNKRLVFYPHYIQTVSTKINYKFLYVSYSIRWVDSAYTLAANTKYYEAYRLDDLHMGVKFRVAHLWSLTADLLLNNIRDESYVLITHYPMPGREWDFRLGITYGAK